MARFPIIETPCPLSACEQEGLSGYCGRCGKTVHALDGMDDAGRAAFMSQAKGPLCVSYRLPVGIGAAIALSLAAPAFADAPTTAEKPTSAAVASTASTAPRSSVKRALAVDTEPTQPVTVFVGGVREPAGSKWTEDLSLPVLPTAVDDAIGG